MGATLPDDLFDNLPARTPEQRQADRMLARRLLGCAVLCVVLAALVVGLWH